LLPRYPIYIPSKGRSDINLTANLLLQHNIPFHVVVEPQETTAYINALGEDKVLELPFSNLGLGVVPARNWIKDHARESGMDRHWQMDDDLKGILWRKSGKVVECPPSNALVCVEDFVDRYENVAMAGLTASAFGWAKKKPFSLNQQVYGCVLTLNKLAQRYRGKYSEDTDMSLQVLADGWCTILINIFMLDDSPVFTSGGHTTDTYKDDGRLAMARSLKRQWPGLVSIKRRWGRPTQTLGQVWRKIDTPLIKKKGVNLKAIQPNDYGI